MLLAIVGGLIWGLMEGLWFFLVPDIFLSYIAVKGVKKAAASTGCVVVGAMVAACLLYLCHHLGFQEYLVKIWSSLPGFYPKMFEVIRGHLQENGEAGLLQGPQSGIPYRFYVKVAAEMNLSLSKILLWTPPARLERILLAPVVVLGLRWILKKIQTKVPRLKVEVLLYVAITLYWIGIYIWYWGLFLPKTY